MAKVLVLYYSSYGHIETMAEAIAEGARSAGATVDIKRVPELVSDELAAKSHFKTQQAAPVAEVADLAHYDAIIVGTPTRFGNMAAPMKYFWDGTLAAWQNGTLVGKPACVFTSSGSQHGGNESTLLSMTLPLMHHGMLVMGLPFTEPDVHHTRQGGTPYGASHVAGADGSPALSETESRLAFAQGRRLANIALKLSRP